MKNDKKRFRVVGVPYGKNVVTYAKKLEDAMNTMHEEGYALQVTETRGGSIVLGNLMTPLAAVLPSMPPPPEAVPAPKFEFSTRTSLLLQRFLRLPGQIGDLSLFIAEVKKYAVAMTRGFTVEELSLAAKELEEAATAHDNDETHKHDEDCRYPQTLRVIAGALREQTQTQLQ